MNAKKLIFIVWLVFTVAGLSSIVFGKSGILAMRKLEAERDRIAANMEKLRAINGELEGSLSALRSDPDALSVYARELGYAASSEDRFIRISGLPAASRRTAQAGNQLKAVRPQSVPDNAIRLFALLTGIAVFIFLVLSSMRPPRRRKHSFHRRSAPNDSI